MTQSYSERRIYSTDSGCESLRAHLIDASLKKNTFRNHKLHTKKFSVWVISKVPNFSSIISTIVHDFFQQTSCGENLRLS